MNFLKTKKDFEKMDFDKKAGMINIYVCVNCQKTYIYFYKDAGVTPHVLTCVKCGGVCESRFNSIKQPNRYWYRPKNIKEIEDLVDACWDTYKDTLYKETNKNKVKKEILKNYIQHYNAGGLFAMVIGK